MLAPLVLVCNFFCCKNRREDDFALVAITSFLAGTRNLIVMISRIYALFRQHLCLH